MSDAGKNESPGSLESLRKRIDEIDEQLQGLISERISIAGEIGRAKKDDDASTFYRPEREAQVLRRIRERNNGPLDDETLLRLMREIMSVSLASEKQMTIAYLGPEGTWAGAAAVKHFGKAVDIQPVSTIADVFAAVERGRADYGIVPVENSTEGFVSHTLDRFLESELVVCGEVHLRIEQQLASKAGGLGDIEIVYSHAQSLGQCRSWLANNLPGVEQESVESNARAAILASETPRSAAIAGAAAADLYGLDILAADIEDQPNNTTRFFVIGKDSFPPSGDDKTSIAVSTRNEVGALHRILEPLARHRVSLSRIESRPSGRELWTYVFFMDLVGHAEDDDVAAVISELRDNTESFRLLGSYPVAQL